MWVCFVTSLILRQRIHPCVSSISKVGKHWARR